MPLKDAIATVLGRNAFYRDGYRLMLRISILQGVVILLLAVTLVAMLLTATTRYVYFATTSDGRIINIVPLDEPYKTNAEVINWAAMASKTVMSLGYNDYKQRIQENTNYFTLTGKQSFTKALQEARVQDTLEAGKLVVTFEPEAAPEIKSSRIKDGRYSWLLQFPGYIRYDGPTPPAQIHVMLLLLIVRVSTLDNPDGIEIEQFIAKPI